MERPLHHHTPMRALLMAVLCLLLASAFLSETLGPWWLGAPKSTAVGGYDAVDVLGQVDASDTPFYISGNPNNVPNARGFANAGGMVVDTVHHRLFVLDSLNSRVLVFNLDSADNLIDRVADNVLCQSTFRTSDTGVTQSRCALYNGSDGRFTGLAYDPTDDRLFVADGGNSRVLVFDTSTIVDGMDAVNVIGQPDFTTNTPGASQNTLIGVNGLAYDGANQRLFVADGIIFGGSAGHRVMVFNVDPLVLVPGCGLACDGPNAVNVLGQPDFDPHGAGSGDTGFYDPQGLAYDASTSYLFVADVNQRVMVFDVAAITDGEPAVHVLGDPDLNTSDVCIGSATVSCTGEVWGLALDQAHEHLFVSDVYNYRVMVFDVAAITDGEDAVNVIGQPDFSSEGSGTSQSAFNGVNGIGYGSSTDTLYVSAGSRVLLFDAAPPITDGDDAYDLLGQLDENGNPVYATDGSDDAPNAQGFNNPEGTVMDTVNHRLYVSDALNARVLVFDLDVSNQLDDHTADVVLGQPDVKTTGTATSQTGLAHPAGMALDITGQRLFVADSDNNRVLVYDTSALANGAPAQDVLGQADFDSNGTGSNMDQMDTPRDVAFDAAHGRLFVADEGNKRVLVFDASALVTGMAADNALGETGNSALPPDPGTLDPYGLAYDGTNDRLFVADYFRDRVIVYDFVAEPLVGDGVGTIQPQQNVLGQSDLGSYGPGGGADRLNFTDCFYCVTNLHMSYDDAGGRLFVPDMSNNRIMVFDVAAITDGEVAVDVVGQNDFDEVGSNGGAGSGAPTQNGLDGPEGLLFDGDTDLLYVADALNNRVMVFSLAPPAPGASTLDHHATDAVGQLDPAGNARFTKNGPNNGPNDRGLNGPTRLALDPVRHRLFVADSENARVLVFNLNASNGLDNRVADAVIGPTDLHMVGDFTANPHIAQYPFGLAYDSVNDRLFVSDFGDASRILIYDTATIDSGEDPVGVLGQPDLDTFNACPTAAAETLCEVRGLAYDEDNSRLFVADQGYNRVLVFDLSGGITDGMAASNVIGQPDFTSTDFNLTQDGVGDPAELAYDPATDLLYLQDPSFNRITIYDVSSVTDGEPAVHVLGQEDFISNGSGLDADSFYTGDDYNAVSVSVDSAGQQLFVADGLNRRVLIFDISTIDDGEDAVHVLGQPDATTNDANVTQDGLTLPVGTAFADGLLYVTDTSSHRIMVWDVATFHISRLTDGTSYEAFTSDFPVRFTTKEFAFSGIRGPLTLEIEQRGSKPFAGIDAAMLRACGVEVPLASATHVTTGQDVRDDIATVDLNVIGAHERPIRASWYMPAGCTDAVLSLNANEYGRSSVPFRYPEEGTATYLLDSARGTPTIDGLVDEYDGADPLFAPYWRPGTGHPDGVTYLFVANDDDYLYIAADVTVDNTDDIGEDWISVTIGSSTFKVTDADPTYGRCAFGITERVPYKHNTCELRIPRSAVPESGTVPLVLGYYGTAAPPVPGGDSAVDVVGQLDDADAPKFTKNGQNNGPNRQGGRFPYVSLDAVHHRLFVSDQGNNRVLVFNLNADNSLPDRDADHVLGQPDFSSGGAGTSPASFDSPYGVSYDGINDRLFVADQFNNRVLVFDTATIVNGEGAVNVIGQPDFTSGAINQGGSMDADTLYGPVGVSIEPLNGLLAVGDNGNGRVLVYDVSGGITDGMSADHVVGAPDMTSAGPGTGATGLACPNGVLAETNTDSLWVADYCNNRVLQFNLFDSSDGPAALHVLGQPDFDTTGYSSATASSMGNPSGMALIESDGSDQRLFVVDVVGNRVLVFNTADGVTDGEDAVDAYGQTTMTGSDMGTTDALFEGPYGADYDEANETLWVSDTNNNRVLAFGPTAAPTPTPGNGGHPPRIGFRPIRIEINEDHGTTDSRNVLVSIFAESSDTFTGTVDVLLSNDPRFGTFVPFRYAIPEQRAGEDTRDIWPKTVGWDLCFGIADPADCHPGNKVVYARFYVNVPAPTPALRPTPEVLVEHPEPTP